MGKIYVFYFLFLNMRINEIIGIMMKEGVDNFYIDLGKQFMGHFKQLKKLKLLLLKKFLSGHFSVVKM